MVKEKKSKLDNIIVTNVFIHENLEERKKAFNKIFVEIINKSEKGDYFSVDYPD